MKRNLIPALIILGALQACSAEVTTSAPDNKNTMPGPGGAPAATPPAGAPAAAPTAPDASATTPIEGHWVLNCTSHPQMSGFMTTDVKVSGDGMEVEAKIYSDSACSKFLMSSHTTGTIKLSEDNAGRDNYYVLEYNSKDVDTGDTDRQFQMIRTKGDTLYFGEQSSSIVAVSEPDTSFPYKKQ